MTRTQSIASTALFGIFTASYLPAQAVLPPRFLPGDSAISPAADNQMSPDIARGGDQFLAVWADNRASTSGEVATGWDIYAMRLDAAGNPIDTVPIVISQGPGDQNGPKVVWNGQNWLQ